MRFFTTVSVMAMIPVFFCTGWADDSVVIAENHIINQPALDGLPLYFIENRGQLDDEVAFYVKGSDKTLYFTSDGITIVLKGRGNDVKKRWTVKVEFLDAEPTMTPEGADKQEAVFSYFKGKPEEWNTNISTYGKLAYKDLWPGIDLVYTGTLNRLKYKFLVKPGADLDRIRLAYHGVSEVVPTQSGAIEIRTPLGGFEDGVPFAYQEGSDGKEEVSMQYVVRHRETGSYSCRFDIGDYDPHRILVLDPDMLVYCGYIGGSNNDSCNRIAVDGQGNVFIAGKTDSDELSFPVTAGPHIVHGGGKDGFIAKVNSQGTGLIYCGYIGGIGDEGCEGIAIDDLGNAYVVGTTCSDESSFPVMGGPDLTHNGDEDAFIAKVDAQGINLIYCGYVGGTKWDYGKSIQVDEDGNPYIVGTTYSDDGSFPVVVGPDLSYGYLDSSNGYIAKINAQGTKLIYCGYIGGDTGDEALDIAIDKAKNAYVVGHTNGHKFPVKIGPCLNGFGDDGFISKVNPLGTGFVYSGLIPGYELDYAVSVTVDNAGNAYVAGRTYSSEATFPVKVGPDLTYNGKWDSFVAKVNAQGTGFDYCGYIGGSEDDLGAGIAIDSKGNAYASGRTGSSETSFPVRLGPDITHNGYNDGFVARVNVQGTKLDYCGFIGGDLSEICNDIAIDSDGNVIVTGSTGSDESSFPVKNGPDVTHNGKTDAFIAKIKRLSLAADDYELSASKGGTIAFTLDAGLPNANRNYIFLGSITGTEPGTTLPGGMAVLPLNWDQFTNVIISMLNTPVFSGFLGTLDSEGKGTAQLNIPPVFGVAGITLHFAYCLNSPWDFVSDAVGIEIVP